MGILWLGINWLSQCALALLLKKILNDGIDSDVALVYYNLGAVIIYSFSCPPWAIMGEIAVAASPVMLIMLILAFGLITQIFGQFCWIKSFSLIDPAITNAMNALAPIVALVLGYFILGETVSAMQLLGIAIVIIAVLILNKTVPADEA